MIAIIGAGRMGTALAERFRAAGLDAAAIGRHDNAPAAVSHANTVMIAIGYPDLAAGAKSAGDLSGKVVVDLINPVGPGLSQAIGVTTSAAEEIQKLAPKAKVVKAFNTIFAALLRLDYAGREPPQVPYAGDDADAKEEVAALVRAIGFDPYDCGPLSNARLLEPMGVMIVQLAYGLGRNDRIAPRFIQY